MKNKHILGKCIAAFTAIIIAVVLYVTAASQLEYVKAAKLGDKTIFTGNVFGQSIFALKQKDNIWGIKLLGHANVPDILISVHSADAEYVLAVGTAGVYIYAYDGSKNKIDLKDRFIQDASVCDLNGDKNSEVILLVSDTPGEYAKELVILTLVHGDSKLPVLKELYRLNCESLNPWKVQTADVDGDGTVEISLGVYKTSPFHRELAKRPFIYNWTPKTGLFPKWRGSRLSRPFDDYVFGDIEGTGMDQIISIEATAEGKKVLASYVWKDFGFEKRAESKYFENISELRCEGKEIIVKFSEGTSSYWGVFIYENNRLVLKAKSLKRIV